MIRDQELMFSDAQVLTATALSTNTVDLGPLSGGNLTRDIAGGDEPLWLHINVPLVLDSAGDAATLVITLESDDVAALNTSPTVHWSSGEIAEATLATGYEIKAPVPSGQYQRHLGFRYTVGTENFTTGTISATIVRRVRNYHNYAAAGGTSIT